MSRLSVFGMNIIILNDMKLAMEMFDKRSSNYSDRPNIVFGCEMYALKDMIVLILRTILTISRRVGWETVALLHYGERHRTIRKHLHQVIGSRNALSRYHSFIEVESRRLLLRILNDPSKLLTHVHR